MTVEASWEVKSLTGQVRSILTVVCLLAVGGCASINFATLGTLRDTELSTVDPSVVRLALDLPAGASFSAIGMTLRFIREGEVLVDEHFQLEVLTSGPELHAPGLPRQEGNRVVLRVPRSKVADVANFQRLYALESEQRRGAQATFGIDNWLDPDWVDEYCAGHPDDLKITSWILVDRQQGYMPLLKNSDIGKFIDAQSSNFCAANKSGNTQSLPIQKRLMPANI